MNDVKIVNESEIWLPVVGYEGTYEVSNLGNLKTLARLIESKHRPRRTKERLMKPRQRANGYLQINFSQKYLLVHRLVAMAFLPNHESKKEVNHINGNKGDNRASNLEWVTRSENEQHSVATGLRVARRLEEHHTLRKVIVYDLSGNEITSYSCPKRAAIELNIPAASIYGVLSGHSRKAGKYVFKYA